MQELRCVAIDDDDLALKLLKDFVETKESIQWEAGFEDAHDAQHYLSQHSTDILLLDIHLPRLNGLDLFQSLAQKPATIISSSFPQYAIDGFQLDVIDFLLKPYSYERFEKAIEKARDYLMFQREKQAAQYFWVKADYQMVKIFFDEVVYVEAQKQYVHIVTDHETIVTLSSLKHMLNLLPSDRFIQVHRSFVISKARVIKKASDFVVLGEKMISVGRAYKKNVVAL